MNAIPYVEGKPWLLLVRFEQGRGDTGVPKTWVPYFVGHPKNASAKPSVATLVRKAVQLFRAACADPAIGHGRDLMPGRDDEYHLHNIDGGKIDSVDQIKWRDIDGHQRAELVLTWHSPAALLPMPTEG